MKEPLHARAISLVLALSVVVGGWLLFEYSNRSMPKSLSPVSTQNSQPEQVSTQLPASHEPQSVEQQLQIQQNVTLTYKCERNGRIRYGDQPCSKNEKTITVSVAEKTNHPDRPLAQLQASVAQMEASRLERAQKQAAVRDISQASSGNQDGKELECKRIDQDIAAIDSRLRQPYDAHTGDYFKGERKKLTDQRFSLGC